MFYFHFLVVLEKISIFVKGSIQNGPNKLSNITTWILYLLDMRKFEHFIYPQGFGAIWPRKCCIGNVSDSSLCDVLC